MSYSVQEIKELIKAYADNSLTRLEIGEGEYSLKLRRECGETFVSVPAPAAAAAAQPVPEAEPQAAAGDEGSYVTSPIVGTFYAAPAPDQAPFVQAGSVVHKGDVLFIIESMKLMNEVTSECDGVVAEVLLESGTPVEYGQRILRME